MGTDTLLTTRDKTEAAIDGQTHNVRLRPCQPLLHPPPTAHRHLADSTAEPNNHPHKGARLGKPSRAPFPETFSA